MIQAYHGVIQRYDSVREARAASVWGPDEGAV